MSLTHRGGEGGREQEDSDLEPIFAIHTLYSFPGHLALAQAGAAAPAGSCEPFQEASPMEEKARALRGFVLATLIRLHLGQPFVLPCCCEQEKCMDEDKAGKGMKEEEKAAAEGKEMEEEEGEDFVDQHKEPAAGQGSSSTCNTGAPSMWSVGLGEICREMAHLVERGCQWGPAAGGRSAAGEQGVRRCGVRALDRAVMDLPLSRQYGAPWARAVAAHWLCWLWRPVPAYHAAALKKIGTLRQGARLLRGEHVALVVPTCPAVPPGDAYPHASDNPCAQGDEWRDGRLDAAPCNGCYPTEAAARCKFHLSTSRVHSSVPFTSLVAGQPRPRKHHLSLSGWQGARARTLLHALVVRILL